MEAKRLRHQPKLSIKNLGSVRLFIFFVNIFYSHYFPQITFSVFTTIALAGSKVKRHTRCNHCAAERSCRQSVPSGCPHRGWWVASDACGTHSCPCWGSLGKPRDRSAWGAARCRARWVSARGYTDTTAAEIKPHVYVCMYVSVCVWLSRFIYIDRVQPMYELTYNFQYWDKSLKKPLIGCVQSLCRDSVNYNVSRDKHTYFANCKFLDERSFRFRYFFGHNLQGCVTSVPLEQRLYRAASLVRLRTAVALYVLYGFWRYVFPQQGLQRQNSLDRYNVSPLASHLPTNNLFSCVNL